MLGMPIVWTEACLGAFVFHLHSVAALEHNGDVSRTYLRTYEVPFGYAILLYNAPVRWEQESRNCEPTRKGPGVLEDYS